MAAHTQSRIKQDYTPTRIHAREAFDLLRDLAKTETQAFVGKGVHAAATPALALLLAIIEYEIAKVTDRA